MKDYQSNFAEPEYPTEALNEVLDRKLIALMTIVSTNVATPLKLEANHYTHKEIVQKVNDIEQGFDSDNVDYIYASYSVQNLAGIRQKINNEFAKCSNYVESDIEAARNDSEIAAYEISKIRYDKISVELTPSNAVKFTLLLDKNKLLMVTKPFANIDVKKGDVLFSFFIDRRLIVSDTVGLSNLVIGFNNYLSA